MARANAAYYAARDPLGAEGDFITAPEISQMFGELIGLWCADLWQRAGTPDIAYVELGPGRGTLSADALRAGAPFGFSPPVHFVETSPALRSMQAQNVPQAAFHETIDSLPQDRPLLIIANEFFDALPIEQCVMTLSGWRQRRVDYHATRGFFPEVGKHDASAFVPKELRTAPEGSIFEISPASANMLYSLAERIAVQGGAILLIDYGHDCFAYGDTLQAVRAHQSATPYETPGQVDLTAHVNFQALSALAQAHGLNTAPVIGQGDFLRSLGIEMRADRLMKNKPETANSVFAALDRLVHTEQMGSLFKAVSFYAAGWPAPEGFALPLPQ